MTNYKQLCAELVEKLDELNCHYNVPNQSAMIERAHDALAESEPERPTDIEIASILTAYAVVEPQMGVSRILHEKHFSNAARAVLARWASSPIIFYGQHSKHAASSSAPAAPQSLLPDGH